MVVGDVWRGWCGTFAGDGGFRGDLAAGVSVFVFQLKLVEDVPSDMWVVMVHPYVACASCRVLCLFSFFSVPVLLDVLLLSLCSLFVVS